MNARDIFTGAYGSTSRNFMTPTRLELKSLARGVAAYELSIGHGFANDTIYGVTIAVLVDGVPVKSYKVHDKLGQCFPSLGKARAHIEWLKDNWTDDLDELRQRLDMRGW